MKDNLNINEIVKETDITYVTNNGHRKKFWFNNNRYLFKYQKVNSLEAYGEIFIYYLSKMCKLNFAQYTLNFYNNNIGVVTKNFLDNNDILVTGADLMIDVYENITNYEKDSIDKMMKKNNIHDIPKIIEMYRKKHNLLFVNTSMNDISTQIIKVCIFDVVTIQTDRNPFNWGVIVNKSKKTIKLSPLYDNSNIAHLNTPDFILNNNYGISKIEFDKLMSIYFPLLNRGKKENGIKLINYFLDHYDTEFKKIFFEIKSNYSTIFELMKKELKENYNLTFETILESTFKMYFDKIDYMIKERSVKL